MLSGTLISSLQIPPTFPIGPDEDPACPDRPVGLIDSPKELLPAGPRSPINGSDTNDAIFFASGSKIIISCQKFNVYFLFIIILRKNSFTCIYSFYT